MTINNQWFFFYFLISLRDSQCDSLSQVKKKTIPLVIIFQLFYCLNIMTNAYDTVSYIPLAWIHEYIVAVWMTSLFMSLCYTHHFVWQMWCSVMLLSIMMGSILLYFKTEGYLKVKGFSNFSLDLRAIICIITTEVSHHFAWNTLWLLIRNMSECDPIFAWHFNVHINQNRSARKAVLLSPDMQ